MAKKEEIKTNFYLENDHLYIEVEFVADDINAKNNIRCASVFERNLERIKDFCINGDLRKSNTANFYFKYIYYQLKDNKVIISNYVYDNDIKYNSLWDLAYNTIKVIYITAQVMADNMPYLNMNSVLNYLSKILSSLIKNLKISAPRYSLEYLNYTDYINSIKNID